MQSTPIKREAPRIRQENDTRGFAREMSLEDCCREAARLGIQGFDLLGPADWPLLRKYGLTPSMYPPGPGSSIPDALNRTENHARIEPLMRADAIDESAAAKVPNIITQHSEHDRKDMGDRTGADNCVAFLNKVRAQAEDKGVTITMELLNSKVNHKDYMFDHMARGVDVMQRVNSPRVKILYTTSITRRSWMATLCVISHDHFQWIRHFHTEWESRPPRYRRFAGVELPLRCPDHRGSGVHHGSF